MDNNTVIVITLIAVLAFYCVLIMAITKSFPWQNKK